MIDRHSAIGRRVDFLPVAGHSQAKAAGSGVASPDPQASRVMVSCHLP